MTKKIGINSGFIWGISRRRLVKALGEYYSDDNPTTVFDLRKPENEIMYDKILMNKKLDELGIPHPITYYFPFDDMPNNSTKCVVKHRFGSRGNHLVFTKFKKVDKADLRDKYVQFYVPFEREYRVAVDFKRVLGIREKIGMSKIMNSKSCKYKTRDIAELREFAMSVAKKFNVDFTGIDIGELYGQYIVIELNSSPTIGEYWASRLAEDLIDRLYRGD